MNASQIPGWFCSQRCPTSAEDWRLKSDVSSGLNDRKRPVVPSDGLWTEQQTMQRETALIVKDIMSFFHLKIKASKSFWWYRVLLIGWMVSLSQQLRPAITCFCTMSIQIDGRIKALHTCLLQHNAKHLKWGQENNQRETQNDEKMTQSEVRS